MKGEADYTEYMGTSEHCAGFFTRMEWRKRLSRKCQKKNPGLGRDVAKAG
jgi:hypothetical protein